MADTPKTKPRPRFLRFSLRTLMLFMLVCGIALIPLAWKLEGARKQREAVAWVHEMGGTVYYDFKIDEDGFVEPIDEPRGPKWIRKWLGRDFLDDRLASCELGQCSSRTCAAA